MHEDCEPVHSRGRRRGILRPGRVLLRARRRGFGHLVLRAARHTDDADSGDGVPGLSRGSQSEPEDTGENYDYDGPEEAGDEDNTCPISAKCVLHVFSGD